MRNVHLQKELVVYIFSCDRPMQLNALLESMLHYANVRPKIVVQYNASSNDAECAYDILSKKFKEITFVRENNFKQTLLDRLDRYQDYKYISFLVDDIIFVRNFCFKNILDIMDQKSIFSLRLGLNLTYSKIINKPQKLPKLSHYYDFYSWSWKEGVMDWGYPFSLDGNIFSYKFIVAFIEKIKFKAPNSLENSLSKSRIADNIKGLCANESILVNLPFNRVQNEVENWSGNVDVHMLTAQFLNGDRIDFLKYENRLISSVHEDWQMHVTS